MGRLYVILKLFTDHVECLEDLICGACDCDDPLWARRVRDVDFGTTLFSELLYIISFLSYYASCFLALHDHPQREGRGRGVRVAIRRCGTVVVRFGRHGYRCC